MLHIQSELLAGKTIPEICLPLGIKYTQKDGKVILTYDQIESPKTHSIVRECRGLILYTDNWDVACCSFERFFNYGETGADMLPDSLGDCLVLPKLDGTMVNLWFDRTDKTWKVATRSMMYAEGNVGTLTDHTFAQLFWEAAEKTKFASHVHLEAISESGTPVTFTFELTSPLNRIVTPYTETSITLLNSRNNRTLQEASNYSLIRVARLMHCNVIQPVHMTDWKELVKMERLAKTDEGFVVVRESREGSHKRVKVKNPAYLAISRLVSAPTERNFLSIIQRGEVDEVLTYYPEYKTYVDTLVTGMKKLAEIVKNDYIDLCKIESRKEFALEAVKRRFPSLLFQMRDGKITNLSIDLLLLRTDALLEMIHHATTN